MSAAAAAKRIEDVRNTSDEPNDPDPIVLSSTVYTEIFSENLERTGYSIGNYSNKAIFIKERAFDDPDDNIFRGKWMPARTSWESPNGRVATGPISIIAESGTPTITAQED